MDVSAEWLLTATNDISTVSGGSEVRRCIWVHKRTSTSSSRSWCADSCRRCLPSASLSLISSVSYNSSRSECTLDAIRMFAFASVDRNGRRGGLCLKVAVRSLRQRVRGQPTTGKVKQCVVVLEQSSVPVIFAAHATMDEGLAGKQFMGSWIKDW